MTTETPDPSRVLLGAIGRLLRPLVRLAIRHGITYPAMTDLLKHTYLDVVEEDLRRSGAHPTDSRLSLLTGVHRKYVKQLRQQARTAPDAGEPRQISLAARIAAVWNSRPEYLDADGEPAPLPRLAAEEGDRSFESLVRSVSRDIHPRVILDEWLRLGAAELDAQDRVVLLRGAFVPVEGFSEQAYYLGRNIHDHLAVIDHNMLPGSAPMLERCVHYTNMNEAACADVGEVAEKAAMKALRAVNDRVLRGGAGARPGQPRWRMNFGVYYFAEPDPEPADDGAGSTAGSETDEG